MNTPTAHHIREAFLGLKNQGLGSFDNIHSIAQAEACPTASRLLKLHAVLRAKGINPYAPRQPRPVQRPLITEQASTELLDMLTHWQRVHLPRGDRMVAAS